MLIKMKESKGFTLVELMIVVAIIGILAAVAVPYYQRYVAKSRLTSLVMPAVHSIETNIGTYFAVQSTLPVIDDNDSLAGFTGDADLNFVTISESDWASKKILKVTVNSEAELDGKKVFSSITANQNYFNIKANTSLGKLYWSYTGPLAVELGMGVPEE